MLITPSMRKLKLNQYWAEMARTDKFITIHRDLIHPRIDRLSDWGMSGDGRFLVYNKHGDQLGEPFKCPYGKVGDRFWIAERWMVGKCMDMFAGGSSIDFQTGPHVSENCVMCATYDERYKNHSISERKWMRARFMPRWASRLTMQICRIDLVQSGDSWLWKIKLEKVVE